MCQIVDETGIVNACFNRYIDKLEIGGVYLMTNLKCGIQNSHLIVEMQYELCKVDRIQLWVSNLIFLVSKINLTMYQNESMSRRFTKRKRRSSLR
jgi:hypothetical protein